MKTVVVIGAGVIGAAVAYRLVKSGARVTLLDRAQPGAGATGASFGWMNASFFHDAEHHRLRVAGLDALRRLQAELGTVPDMRWDSALWYEAQGADMARMAADLSALGYPVRRLDANGFADAAPGVLAPDAALQFEFEGAVDAAGLARCCVAAAQDLGARLQCGITVTGLERHADGVTVVTDHGRLHADDVVVAVGTGAAALTGLPMLKRPGVLMKTQPLPPFLRSVLVTPDGEIRQDAEGRLVMPTAAQHQSDDTEAIDTPLESLADAALARLERHFPKHDLRWTEVTVAARPVPADGLPAIGALDGGGYMTVMHSGVTLAAVTAEYATREILTGQRINALGPYRPQRFD